VISTLKGQFLLGEISRLPDFSEDLSEQFFCGGYRLATATLLHTQSNPDTIQTIVPETIVQIHGNRKGEPAR
jgi:hypothetical protein